MAACPRSDGLSGRALTADHILSLQMPPSDFAAALHQIASALPPAPPAEQIPPTTQDLVQAAFLFLAQLDQKNILGDLRHVAKNTVAADDLAVLLVNPAFSDLQDTLNLGTPGTFLQVCRAEFARRTEQERLEYLGEEVLVRSRAGLPSTTSHLREAEAAGAESYMRMPLIMENRLAGFVAVFSSKESGFRGPHLQLARLFTAQIANAIRNSNLFLRLRQFEQRQKAISEVARLMTEDMSLDIVLARVVQEAVGMVDGQMGAVLLVQADNSLVISAIHGDDPGVIGRIIPEGAGQAGMIAKTGQPSTIRDYYSWASALSRGGQSPQPITVLGVPLIYKGGVLGVLQVVFNDQNSDVQEHQNVLTMFAPQAATAIATARLHDVVRRERQQLQAILDHTTAVIIVFNAEGRLLLANPEAQRIIKQMGITAEQIAKGRVDDVLRLAMPEQPPRVLAELGSVAEINLGDAGEYLMHIAPISREDGTIERYICVAQDVSALRRLDRLKSDLIHILSHDLRNPLGLARGSLSLLQETNNDMTPSERVQLVDMLDGSLDRMDELIDDVVRLEAAEEIGHDTSQPYLLLPLVDKVVKENRRKAEQGHLTLNYTVRESPTHHLSGHALLVAQAVDNLISNAIKYTPEGGRVDVLLFVEGNWIVVEVKDTGYGIPESSLPLLFQRFYRVKDRRNSPYFGVRVGTLSGAGGGEDARRAGDGGECH